MSEHHQHTHSHRKQGQSGQRRHDDHPFLIPFILIFIFAFIEFYFGIWAKSLALLGDAWHMFSDVLALGVAMLAAYSASKQKNLKNGQTKFEILASIFNAFLMLIVIIWIMKEAVVRIDAPQTVASGYVMVVALIGLIINLIVAKQLHHQTHQHNEDENLNYRAALLHVLGDLLGSVIALVSGIVIYFTGWLLIDPILSIVIALLLLAVTLNLMKDILRTYKANPQTQLRSNSQHVCDEHDHSH